jgi:membrane associated rhomboid family serine protease
MAVEAELGTRKTLVIFFLGAVAGDMLSLLVYPFDAISIGASAGIFALIGTGMLVRPIDLSFWPLIVPIPLAFLGILYAVYNIYGFITQPDSNISYIAHFGGLIVGLYFGFKSVGIKKGVKIVLLTLLLMVLIPLIWLLIT